MAERPEDLTEAGLHSLAKVPGMQGSACREHHPGASAHINVDPTGRAMRQLFRSCPGGSVPAALALFGDLEGAVDVAGSLWSGRGVEVIPSRTELTVAEDMTSLKSSLEKFHARSRCF